MTPREWQKVQEIIRKAMASQRLDLHTALPGIVKSYNATTQTADIQPAVRGPIPKGRDGWDQETLPVIPNVPIAWIQGGGASIQLTLAEGDHVLLIFNEADISGFRQTGDVADAHDLARHDLSYPYAIPCGHPDASPLPTVTIPHIEIPGAQTITVGQQAADDFDFVAMAQKVMDELNSIRSAVRNHTHTVPPGTDAAGGTTGSAPSIPSVGDVSGSKLKAQN